MLSWLYLFSFYLICSIISLYIFNKQWISVLLIGEVILIFCFFILITIGSLFNIYFIFFFSFIVLMFGGLELAISLLLLIL